MTILDLLVNEINNNIKELSNEEYLKFKANKKIKYTTSFIEELILCKIRNDKNTIDAGVDDEINCFLDLDTKYFIEGVYRYINRYVWII